jgi:RHS repeat-associated protein
MYSENTYVQRAGATCPCGRHALPKDVFAISRCRVYDPGPGRFTSQDPFPGSPSDPQSLHKYLYCEADPVNRIDPTGMFSIEELGVSIAIGAIMMGSVSGSISVSHGHSFWGGFLHGAWNGAVLGGSIYLAAIQGPAVLAKSLAVGAGLPRFLDPVVMREPLHCPSSRCQAA